MALCARCTRPYTPQDICKGERCLVSAATLTRLFVPHPPPHPTRKPQLEAADVRKGLSNLGVTANGTQRAYLALKLTGLGLGDISLLQRFVHLQVVDLSDNQLRGEQQAKISLLL